MFKKVHRYEVNMRLVSSSI